MYARCHHVNQVGQLDRQRQGWQECEWVTGSLGAALLWMVGIRDIHTKGQSGRIREQSCLRRPLFLIQTSGVLLSTSLPLSPTGISECMMMCPSRQTASASLKSVESRNCCQYVRAGWMQTFEICYWIITLKKNNRGVYICYMLKGIPRYIPCLETNEADSLAYCIATTVF